MKSNNYECPVCHETFHTGVGYAEHKCGVYNGIFNDGDRDTAFTTKSSLVDLAKAEAGFDPVEKPEGYNQGKIECIDYIADKKMDAFEGNIVKYVTRHKFKNGKKDIEKAGKYIRMMLDRYEDLYG